MTKASAVLIGLALACSLPTLAANPFKPDAEPSAVQLPPPPPPIHGAGESDGQPEKPKLPPRKLGAIEMIGVVDGAYIYRSDTDYWFTAKGNKGVHTPTAEELNRMEQQSPRAKNTVQATAVPTNTVAGTTARSASAPTATNKAN